MPGFLGKGQQEWRRLRGRLFRRAPAPPAPAVESEPEVAAAEAEESPAVEAPAADAGPLRWLRAGEAATVGDTVVRGPCYVGEPEGSGAPPAHAHLALNAPAAEAAEGLPRGLKAGRATGYTTLTPDEQLEYLQWCAHGRPAGAPREAHALIHVYGLEYRGLQDVGAPEAVGEDGPGPELREVLDELERFAAGNRPWTSAARHALAAVRVAAGDDPTAWRLRNTSEDEPPLDVIWWLGHRLRDGGRLHARDAYLWLHANGARPAGTNDFRLRARFRDAYRRRRQGGWRPASPLGRIGDFAYHSVSGVFMTTLGGRLEGLPDVRTSALLDDAARILRSVGADEAEQEPATKAAAPPEARGQAPGFSLDEEQILALQSETAEAESILSRFFGESDNEETAQ